MYLARRLSTSGRNLTAKISDATRRLEQDDRVLTVDRDVVAIAEAIEPPVVRGIDKVKSQTRRLPARRHAAANGHSSNGPLRHGTLPRSTSISTASSAGSHCFRADAPTCLAWMPFYPPPTVLNPHSRARQALPTTPWCRPSRNREDTLGLPFSALSPDQSERSATLLEHWFHMARQGSVEPALVAGFFADLGLALSATSVEPRGNAQAVIRAEPLRARDLCPAHAFGSGARGRYSIVFNWHVQAREPIIQALAAGDPNVRTIVLHFGKLTRADREWLRRWSIEQSTQFITIDETLVLYLASLPREMLRALFDGTLPFTGAEPYFTAPGLVPPESFFGREGERTRITDPYGSCFVYGGRQLGKTALLQAAQAAFHNPEERHLAEYVDLKARDVGIADRRGAHLARPLGCVHQTRRH